MVSKEEFNKVWKDSSRENILNQFYYEHYELFRIKKEISEYNEQIIKDTKDFYRPTEDIIYSGDTLIDIATQNLDILDKGDKGE